MRVPLLELAMIATVIIGAKMSGDGFARTVEGYDAVIHGEDPSSRYMSCPYTNRQPGLNDQQLIQSWDDQFQAMRYNDSITGNRQPTFHTLMTSLASEVL